MADAPAGRRTVAIVVHGGAWSISDADAPLARCVSPAVPPTQHQDPPPSPLPKHSAGAAAAARAGWSVLSRGGSALDAVEAAVRSLEDCPVFDAGTGSVLSSAGQVEMDALIVDGTTLGSGAVVGINNVAHPITIARAVLATTPHAMLAGEGARDFASSTTYVSPVSGAVEPIIDGRTLVTPAAVAEWESRKTASASASFAAGVRASFKGVRG